MNRYRIVYRVFGEHTRVSCTVRADSREHAIQVVRFGVLLLGEIISCRLLS